MGVSERLRNVGVTMTGGNRVPGDFLETYRTENRGERVGLFWGHTLDEDPGAAPPERTVTLEEWVDECVALMANPSSGEFAEYESDGWVKPEDFGRD